MDPGFNSERSHPNCRCDICRETPLGIRWKCANCLTFDLCEKCFAASRNKDDPDHAKVAEACKKTGHALDSHVYIRQEFQYFVKLPY